ncbi:hypothetical protein A3D83_01500 [Candidatus Daviesbacteria bacterium RIFCSPHIGHO2_02_FULL_41_10]|uniref:Uncharacterized protein n=1 Tax=Candidatus Daviesbacteria bacterium RIFCSPHIGHO2_02_FULL_41_10 TaxID=1797774 RepID=A0A1F5JVP0_9BACT|nr:MAG: hypothetical protein A3D83_01500 [Candidatus Daviesbacteria bacterium RIFCSPHIGHO2_02_FULL_41_10]
MVKTSRVKSNKLMVELRRQEGLTSGEVRANLPEQLNRYLVNFKGRLRIVRPDLATRWLDSEVQDANLIKKILGFIGDNNEMCEVWYSERMQQARDKELESQGPTHVFKIKCIDGRKPRGFEGPANSLKAEGGLLALKHDPTTRRPEPLSSEICIALSDSNADLLEMNVAHYDSTDPNHGCAAIGRVITDHSKGEESVWPFLSSHEKSLVIQAGGISHEYAGMVLMELTNSKALNEIHRRYMVCSDTQPIKQVAVTVLADTRTMGLELRVPLLKAGQAGLELVPANEQKVLSTAQLTHDFETDLTRVSNFPVGAFKETFNDKEHFVDYYEALVDLSAVLSKPENGVSLLFEKVNSFIKENYPNLSSGQTQAFRYRVLRTVAHQYLTGLHHPQDHPFSDHDEKFISIGPGTDYVGKYETDKQCFRMSGPDAKTATRRLVIAASVMDKTKVDGEDPHIIFLCTPVRENGDAEEYQNAYADSATFYRSLMNKKIIRDLIRSKNILPVPVLISFETNKVLEVVSKNAIFA